MNAKPAFTKYIVIGRNSRIACSFCEQNKGVQIVSLSRTLYDENALQGNFKELFATLSKSSDNDTLVLIFAGITDPSSTQLDLVNFEMPFKIIKFCNARGISTATFGSVMENKGLTNPYVRSKYKLLRKLKNQSYQKHFHFQLNTIYGGKSPPRNMFLGEMIECIKEGIEFEMTSGLQFREYQSSEDCVRECLKIIENGEYGIREVNLNEDFMLVELARYIFSKLGIIEKLKIRRGKIETELYQQQKRKFKGKRKDIIFSEIFRFVKIQL